MTAKEPGESRLPRARRRSRYGCRNCKLRKLKCDEGKPQCKRCCSFGVLCNFMSNVPDLQPVAADTRTLLISRPNTKCRLQLQRPEVQRSVCSAVWTHDVSTSYQYQLNAKCQDFITRYLERSLVSPDDPSWKHVNRRLLHLAFTNPYLMHASLAVAFTYDRYLNSSSCSRRSPEECYHWSQGAALLNKQLEQPIKDAEKDPIWGTAAALTILTFSSPEACTPDESWPLKPSKHSDDLDWLHMSEGKMSLWHMVDPLRPESIYSVMAATYAQMDAPAPEKGTEGIPTALAAVCYLNESSTTTNNPYFFTAHALSQILAVPDSQVSTGHAQLFMRSIDDRFKRLLQDREPVALLLLYLWYRKVGRSIWWIELRARVECPSICSYLRLHYQGNDAIQAFLPGGIFADGSLHEWACIDSTESGSRDANDRQIGRLPLLGNAG